MGIKIEIVNQLVDNYSYIVHNSQDKKAIIIDLAEEDSVIEFIEKNELKPIAVLITHHHSDHTSGIKGLIKKFKVDVYTSNKNIYGTTHVLKDKQKINFNFIEFEIISTPGHTLDHIVYFSDKEKLLFSGDTLFYYGCGRVFEGTMDQMLISLKKLKSLPDDTKVYCGHEYTYKNLEFILDELVTMQEKGAVKQKYREMIKKNGSSMPFYLGHQKDWNPFLNCDDVHYKQGIAEFYKNEGKIRIDATELEFFTFIRQKRNDY